MSQDYIDNYKSLCGSIVFEQCIEYSEAYSSWYKSPNRGKPWRDRRVNKLKEELLYGFSRYLDIDIDSVVTKIEEKIEKGEKIEWKKREVFSARS